MTSVTCRFPPSGKHRSGSRVLSDGRDPCLIFLDDHVYPVDDRDHVHYRMDDPVRDLMTSFDFLLKS